MENQVSEQEVKDRFDRLLKEVQEASRNNSKKLEGKVEKVLVESENEHLDGHIYTEKVIGNVYNAGDAEAEREAEIAAGLPVEEEN